MKKVAVYRNSNYYIIATAYRRESWAYMLGKPIYRLKTDSTTLDLSEHLFKALDASRDISEVEENEFDLETKVFLKELGVKSLKELYTKFYNYDIDSYDKFIQLTPEIPAEDGRGMILDESKIARIYFDRYQNELEIFERLQQIMDQIEAEKS